MMLLKWVSQEFSPESSIYHYISKRCAELQNAVAATAQITGGALDYLIANAAYVSEYDAYDPIGVL